MDTSSVCPALKHQELNLIHTGDEDAMTLHAHFHAKRSARGNCKDVTGFFFPFYLDFQLVKQ